MDVFSVGDPELRGVFLERMFVWKRQGRLAALDWGGFQSRNAAMVKLLELADHTYGLAEFGPLTISTGDQPVNVDPSCLCLGFSETDGYQDIAIPDFLFTGWPETGIADYAETTWQVEDAGASPAEQSRCGWIGDPNLHERRYQLIEISQARPDLLDASGIDWATGHRIRSPIDRDATVPFNYRSLPQQASRWSSLIDVEGKGYSPRLKILLHSGRPVFIQDRPWREWYCAELTPMENFIPVKRDLSDLVEKLEWAQDNPHEAAAIGRAGQALALAKLTREAAILELVRTLERVGREHSEASYVPEDLRAPLDPVLTSFGAFA
jgi:Glycosyl transferase family 90